MAVQGQAARNDSTCVSARDHHGTWWADDRGRPGCGRRPLGSFFWSFPWASRTPSHSSHFQSVWSAPCGLPCPSAANSRNCWRLGYSDGNGDTRSCCCCCDCGATWWIGCSRPRYLCRCCSLSIVHPGFRLGCFTHCGSASVSKRSCRCTFWRTISSVQSSSAADRAGAAWCCSSAGSCRCADRRSLGSSGSVSTSGSRSEYVGPDGNNCSGRLECSGRACVLCGARRS